MPGLVEPDRRYVEDKLLGESEKLSISTHQDSLVLTPGGHFDDVVDFDFGGVADHDAESRVGGLSYTNTFDAARDLFAQSLS